MSDPRSSDDRQQSLQYTECGLRVDGLRGRSLRALFTRSSAPGSPCCILSIRILLEAAGRFSSGFSTGTNVAPFDSSLGVLKSFSVLWDINFDLSGTASTTGLGGFGQAGGSYFLDGFGYGGMGNEAGGGAAPGSPFDASFSIIDNQGFSIPASGYDPTILAAVEGGSDFDLFWSASYTGMVNAASWTASVNGSATITYDWVPEPSSAIPILLGLAVMGTLYRGAASH